MNNSQFSSLIHNSFNLNEWRIANKTFAMAMRSLRLVPEFWLRQTYLSIFSICLIPLTLINPFLTQRVIDGPLMNKQSLEFLKFGFVIALMSIVIMLAQNLYTYLQNRFATNLRETVTKNLYNRLTAMSVDFFNDGDRSRNSAILSSDGVEVVVWALPFVANVGVLILTTFAKLGMVFYIDWRLGAIALISPPFYILRANILARRNREIASAEREAGLAYSKELSESLGNVNTMKSFRTEAYHTKRFNQALNKLSNLWSSNHRFAFIFGGASGLMTKILDGLPVFVASLLVTQGQLSIGQLSAAMIFISQFVAAQSQLIELIPELNLKSVSVNTLNEFLEKRPTIIESPMAKEVDFSNAEISIENIDFSYTPQIPVIKNFSCKFKPGTWTGIKAPSGYGKTTLVHLILRLYDVKKGAIKINGVDIKHIKFVSFADQIATVPQAAFIPNQSLEKCILYDREDISHEEVRESARLAGIDDFIMSLPEGYNTTCGDAAVRLSQGQRQRIIIARALLRKPKILIMDESFNALDKNTEYKIFDELKTALLETTVIIISHHPSILDRMDEVIDMTLHSCLNPSADETIMQNAG